MKLFAPVCAALLAAGAAAPAHSQRDTIRFGRPDSARVAPTPPVAQPPAIDPSVADSIFDAPGTRELMREKFRALGAFTGK